MSKILGILFSPNLDIAEVQMKNFQLKFIKNQTVVRWLQLLNGFEKYSECTINQLMNLTNTSKRTIIKDIADIRKNFFGVIIIDSTSEGYVFQELDPEAYMEKKRMLLQNEPIMVILESIFFNELQSAFDWATHFEISERTLISYINKVNTLIEPFQVYLMTDPVTLVGSEIDIQNFFCTFYYESELTPHTVLPTIHVQEAVIEINKLFKSSYFQSSSFVYFTYILYIIIERSKQGFSLKLPKEIKKLVQLHQLVEDPISLNRTIGQYFEHQLNEEEMMYMILCLLTRRKVNNIERENEFCQRFGHWPETQQLAKEFYASIESDSQNRGADLILLESFFVRVKLRQMISRLMIINIEDVNTYIKNQFPKEYTQYYRLLKESTNFQYLYGNECIDNICTSLTLHFEAIKEETWGTPRRIAVILEGNSYVCEYIESWIRKYFGKFHIIYYPDSNELTHQYVQNKNINLLITNYSEYMTEWMLEVDCVLLKSMPDASDWNRLLNHINPKITHSVHLNNN